MAAAITQDKKNGHSILMRVKKLEPERKGLPVDVPLSDSSMAASGGITSVNFDFFKSSESMCRSLTLRWLYQVASHQ
jgi:hypothetical protein